MKIVIKNMLSSQSKTEVKGLLTTVGLHPKTIEIGEIEIEENHLCPDTYSELKELLHKNNYELVIKKELILIEKIKSVVIEMIYYSDELPKVKYSDYISERLGVHYTYLSKIFSKTKNITIQQYIIIHKIERVKQLLLYDELTLSQIAWKLQYSSAAHLSGQFKKITGQTPSDFKKLENKKLNIPINLEEIEY
ncbi:helix-turn-helix domain-containing protein [Aquimarina pacifica]|uniref:helix-turn-helix domain-containing protein n=1 Tax=Aquimarina pacifica TaxID=1296415 RepID=UPI00047140EC|nr:helix-turn-helix transcriptional regulator [Aquimarina pacifica]